ncbi:MAG: hypothetical protein R6V44_02850 [Paracoccaceae bacterium]
MEPLAAALADLPLAETIRVSRWGYATASGLHVLGLALLVGAIVPLDLRLLGLWRGVPLSALARPLIATAACGLALAVGAGTALLLAAPARYLAEPMFGLKLAFVLVGAGAALALHLGPGLRGATPRRLRVAGALSLACWLPALALGRLLAFLD